MGVCSNSKEADTVVVLERLEVITMGLVFMMYIKCYSVEKNIQKTEVVEFDIR